MYSDPGSPLSRRTPMGTYVIAALQDEGGFSGRQLLLSGSGASPEGNRPFVDLLDLSSKETLRLWQSSPPQLERPGSIMSDSAEGFTAPITLDRCGRGTGRRAAIPRGQRSTLSAPVCAPQPQDDYLARDAAGPAAVIHPQWLGARRRARGDAAD